MRSEDGQEQEWGTREKGGEGRREGLREKKECGWNVRIEYSEW